MKGFVISLVILILIVGAVVGNAVFVHHTTDILLADLATLPSEPIPDETPAAIAAVRRDFEKHSPILGITVTYTVLDRVTESLLILESQAVTGDSLGYAATLTLLRELAEEIGRLERVSVTNILCRTANLPIR